MTTHKAKHPTAPSSQICQCIFFSHLDCLHSDINRQYSSSFLSMIDHPLLEFFLQIWKSQLATPIRSLDKRLKLNICFISNAVLHKFFIVAQSVPPVGLVD